MTRVLRGHVFWANLSPARGYKQAGRRPVAVLSNQVFNEQSGRLLKWQSQANRRGQVFPLTDFFRNGDLPKKSWVKICQVRTFSALRFDNKIGQIKAEELERLIEGLHEIVSG